MKAYSVQMRPTVTCIEPFNEKVQPHDQVLAEQSRYETERIRTRAFSNSRTKKNNMYKGLEFGPARFHMYHDVTIMKLCPTTFFTSDGQIHVCALLHGLLSYPNYDGHQIAIITL